MLTLKEKNKFKKIYDLFLTYTFINKKPVKKYLNRIFFMPAVDYTIIEHRMVLRNGFKHLFYKNRSLNQYSFIFFFFSLYLFFFYSKNFRLKLKKVNNNSIESLNKFLFFFDFFKKSKKTFFKYKRKVCFFLSDVYMYINLKMLYLLSIKEKISFFFRPPNYLIEVDLIYFQGLMLVHGYECERLIFNYYTTYFVLPYMTHKVIIYYNLNIKKLRYFFFIKLLFFYLKNINFFFNFFFFDKINYLTLLEEFAENKRSLVIYKLVQMQPYSLEVSKLYHIHITNRNFFPRFQRNKLLYSFYENFEKIKFNFLLKILKLNLNKKSFSNFFIKLFKYFFFSFNNYYNFLKKKNYYFFNFFFIKFFKILFNLLKIKLKYLKENFLFNKVRFLLFKRILNLKLFFSFLKKKNILLNFSFFYVKFLNFFYFRSKRFLYFLFKVKSKSKSKYFFLKSFKLFTNFLFLFKKGIFKKLLLKFSRLFKFNFYKFFKNLSVFFIYIKYDIKNINFKFFKKVLKIKKKTYFILNFFFRFILSIYKIFNFLKLKIKTLFFKLRKLRKFFKSYKISNFIRNKWYFFFRKKFFFFKNQRYLKAKHRWLIRRYRIFNQVPKHLRSLDFLLYKKILKFKKLNYSFYNKKKLFFKFFFHLNKLLKNRFKFNINQSKKAILKSFILLKKMNIILYRNFKVLKKKKIMRNLHSNNLFLKQNKKIKKFNKLYKGFYKKIKILNFSKKKIKTKQLNKRLKINIKKVKYKKQTKKIVKKLKFNFYQKILLKLYFYKLKFLTLRNNTYEINHLITSLINYRNLVSKTRLLYKLIRYQNNIVKNLNFFLIIKSTKNNLFCYIFSNYKLKFFIYKSNGISGFKGPLRSSASIGEKTGFLLGKKAYSLGVRRVVLLLNKKLSKKIKECLKGFLKTKIRIKRLLIIPKIAHNGVRSQKRKRR